MSGARAVAALILAAGRGTRFGAETGASKAVAPIGGVPMVRRVADVALESCARPVVIVTGHAAPSVATALDGLSVTLAHNPDYAEGLAGSLKTGLAALPPDVAGVLVLLADMPQIMPRTLDALITAFEGAPAGTDAVIPVHEGRAGNPLLLARSFFPRLMTLEGDHGARGVLEVEGSATMFVDVSDEGVAIDVDTQEDLRAIDRR